MEKRQSIDNKFCGVKKAHQRGTIAKYTSSVAIVTLKSAKRNAVDKRFGSCAS